MLLELTLSFFSGLSLLVDVASNRLIIDSSFTIKASTSGFPELGIFVFLINIPGIFIFLRAFIRSFVGRLSFAAMFFVLLFPSATCFFDLVFLNSRTLNT